MDKKLVKDLMVSVDSYPIIKKGSTLLDAILAMDKAQKNLQSDRQPYRAVLVIDEQNKIIGKIGQLTFLNALSLNVNYLGDLDRLDRLGVHSDSLSSLKENIKFFQADISDLCRRASHIKVEEVMHPITESIEEDAALIDAINKTCMWQTLSIPVSRNGEIVGLLRLSDIFAELTDQIRHMNGECE